MFSSMASYVNRLDSTAVSQSSIIRWSCPVPFFGEIAGATVATVGINPSSREFLSADGIELQGEERRLPTLRSLGCRSWLEVDAVQIKEILAACETYFLRSPYNRWFQVLEKVLAPAGVSLYRRGGQACHIDLVPYATNAKWGSLPLAEQRNLIEVSRDALARLLHDSQLSALILNGQSVVREFERTAEIELERCAMPEWVLPRSRGAAVRGLAYTGHVDHIGGVDIGREVIVVGYNHNLQSSFGVTSAVVSAIARWLVSVTDGVVRGATTRPSRSAASRAPACSVRG